MLFALWGGSLKRENNECIEIEETGESDNANNLIRQKTTTVFNFSLVFHSVAVGTVNS
jgi:hypothetical protein